ncbi:MAG: hypothetical protein K9H58_19565 [Bacteroidales bacterium]|nr:hypothetical protein [Bacteroidales bacterium]
MKNKNFIVRNFDQTYVVWLQEFNQWIQLEEPAYLVFEEVMTAPSAPSASSGTEYSGTEYSGVEGAEGKLVERYGLDPEEAQRFVGEILDVLGGLKIFAGEDNVETNFVEDETDEEEIIHTYKANGVVLRFEYASELLEYYNHHSFAHLEIAEGGEEKIEAVFRVFDSNGTHVLKQVKPVRQEWSDVEIPGLKRRILIEFGNVIYDKDISEWMSIIHGAFVTNRKQGILLSSASGSGKSTLAALLQKEGYELASDDYVPLDAETGLIYPFPAAFSVKSGSFELLSKYYPELKSTPEKKFRLTNKALRFLPPADYKNFNYTPCPATHLVFVKYNPEVDFKIAPLKIPEALKRFSEEAWISGNPDHAEGFIDWFSELKCYELEYSDEVRVVEEMGNLLM